MIGKKILILAPHGDDAELGCGGTISKYAELGSEIHVLVFSLCQNNELEKEVRQAMNLLKVKEVILLGYPVRKLNFHRQEILDEMINFRNLIKPDIVFTPSKSDIHQDHFTITREAERAFKNQTIISYEMPWNNFSFNTNMFVKLEERQIEDKCGALNFYNSQKHKSYFNPEFIKSLARVRGTQINTRYAEAFEIIRQIL